MTGVYPTGTGRKRDVRPQRAASRIAREVARSITPVGHEPVVRQRASTAAAWPCPSSTTSQPPGRRLGRRRPREPAVDARAGRPAERAPARARGRGPPARATRGRAGSTYGGLLTTRSIRPARWADGREQVAVVEGDAALAGRGGGRSRGRRRGPAPRCRSRAPRRPVARRRARGRCSRSRCRRPRSAGRSTSFRRLEARLDEQLRLGARDQHGGRDEELVLPEGLGAEDVLQGLAGGAPPDERAEALRLRLGDERGPGSRRARPGPSRGRGAAGARRPTPATALPPRRGSRRRPATSAAGGHGGRRLRPRSWP